MVAWVRAGLVLMQLSSLTAQDDGILSAMRSGDERRASAAVASWRATADGGLSLLPQVLQTVRDQRNHSSLIFNVQQAIQALGEPARPALRAALLQQPIAPPVLQIVVAAAPWLLCEPEVIQVVAQGDAQGCWDAARALAKLAKEGDDKAPCAFVELLQRVKVDWKNNVLASARESEGDWLVAIFPDLRPLLRTTLGGSVFMLLAGQRAKLPDLVDDVRALLQHGNLEERHQYVWALAAEPEAAPEFAPELLLALPQSAYTTAQGCLRAIANAGVSDGAVREAVLARLSDPSPAVAIEAIGTAAVLGFDGDDLIAMLRSIAAAPAGSARGAAAAELLWALDPSQGTPPRPGDLAGSDETRPLQVVAVLVRARATPEPGFAKALVTAVQHGQLPMLHRALVALARVHPSVDDLAALERMLSAGRHAATVQQAMLALGTPGLVVLGRALANGADPAPLAQLLVARGDAARPALVAAAGAVLLRSHFATMPPQWLQALPPSLQPALRDPFAYLAAIAGSPQEPAALRTEALRALSPLYDPSSAAFFDLTLACLDSDDDGLRHQAITMLRRSFPAHRARLEQLWLQGRAVQRHVAGALLRTLDVTLPPLPPWLAGRLHGDPELRAMAALSLANAGDCTAAAALLAELATDDLAALPLLQAMVRTPSALPPLASAALPFAHSRDPQLRRAAVAVLRAAGVGELQAASFADNRALWCSDASGWTRPLAEAALAQFAALPAAERAALLQVLLRLPAAALPSRTALAAATASSWADADAWVERAQLVPVLLQLGLPLPATPAEALRMADDARGEVARTGLLLALALGCDRLERELEPRFDALAASDRLLFLQQLAVLGALPSWLDCADLLPLQQESVDALLQVLQHWQPIGSHAERQQLAAWLLAQTDEARAERIVHLLLQLDVALPPLLFDGEPPHARLRQQPGILRALGKEQPRLLLSLLPQVAADEAGSLLRAVGEGADATLLVPLRAMLRAPATMAGAVSALRCAGDAGLQAVLALAAEDFEQPLVLQALGDWGVAGRAAIARLSALARNRDYQYSALAVATLARLGSPGLVALEQLGRDGVDVAAAVYGALLDADDEVVIAALRTLVALRPKGAGARVAGLRFEQRSERVRRWRAAIDAELNGRPPAAAGKADLQACLSADEPKLRLQALRAMVRLDPPPPSWQPLLVEALEDPDADVRLGAARLLANDPLAQKAAVAIAERLHVETDARVRQALQGLAAR